VTQFGVDPTQVTRLPLSGWWLAEYPATLAGPAERSSFTKMLAASGFYTSPVLRSDDGQTFATPTPALLVRFKDGIPAEWAERVISEVAGASAVFDAFDTDTQGRSGLYRVVPSVLYGEEVLRLANRFASRRDVDIAEADMLFSGRSKLGDMPVEEASFWQNGRLDIAVIGDGNQSVGMIERHAAQFLGTHAAVASVGGFVADTTTGTVAGTTTAVLDALARAMQAGALVTHTDANVIFPSRFVAERFAQMAENGVRHIVPEGEGFPSGLECVIASSSAEQGDLSKTRTSMRLAAAALAMRLLTPEHDASLLRAVVADRASSSLIASGTPGDLDGNGIVDASDIAEFLARSEQAYTPELDVNADGSVDSGDLVEMLRLQSSVPAQGSDSEMAP